MTTILYWNSFFGEGGGENDGSHVNKFSTRIHKPLYMIGFPRCTLPSHLTSTCGRINNQKVPTFFVVVVDRLVRNRRRR